jgi:hypothetical protein
MQLSSLSIIWAAAASAWLLGSIAADDCNVGEQLLEFTFFLDEDSTTENGWTLACEEEGTIWNVPIGTLQSSNTNAMGFVHQDSEMPFVTEQACLPEDFTCHFTLEDLHGDGLLFPGYYYLTFGATTVAVSEKGEEFFEKSYCFGPNCSIPAQEVAEQCDSVFLFFQADDSPEESSVEIECNGSTLFSKSDFMTPFEAVEFEYCLPIDQCCTLTVSDFASNGLSSSLQGGHAFVEWANQVIFSYGDSNAYRFDSVSLNFGLACPNVDPNPPEASSQVEDDTEQQQEEEEEQDPSAPNDLPEDTNGINQDMVKDQPDGMSSTMKLGLALFASLVVVGLSMLTIARYCYTHPTGVAVETSTTIGKDVEALSVSSKDTAREDEF